MAGVAVDEVVALDINKGFADKLGRPVLDVDAVVVMTADDTVEVVTAFPLSFSASSVDTMSCSICSTLLCSASRSAS